MKPETILKKAIEKAVKNGWDGIDKHKNEAYVKWSTGEDGLCLHYFRNDTLVISINDIIFSHDFCKAFWGTGLKGVGRIKKDNTFEQLVPNRPAWEIHLQRMVLEKDRIKYLEQFL